MIRYFITKKRFWVKFMKVFLKKNCCLLLAVLLSVCFFVCSIYVFGTTKSVSTSYQAKKWQGEKNYDTVVFELSHNKNDDGSSAILKEIWINTGLDVNAVSTPHYSIRIFSSSVLGETFRESHGLDDVKPLENNPKYFNKWIKLAGDIEFTQARKYFQLVTSSTAKINEIVFVDTENQVIPVKIVGAGYAVLEDVNYSYNKLTDEVKNGSNTAHIKEAGKMIDEQNLFDPNKIVGDNYVERNRAKLTEAECYTLNSVVNLINDGGGYMDKTVNPLGLEIMAISVRMFGANTFGLRFMPLLFTALSIVAVFFLGKILFNKKDGLGLMLAVLFALCGFSMFYATIGLVDAIFNFFVILSALFMIVFYKKGMNSKKKLRTSLPLILSGLFFSLAIATKMQAVYALIGLSIIFGLSLYRQYKAYKLRETKIENGEVEDKSMTKDLNKTDYITKLIITVLIFVFSFVLLPVIALIVCYLIGIKAYSSAYGANNVLVLMYTNISGMLGRANKITRLYIDKSLMLSWLINYRSQGYSAVKGVYGNPIIMAGALGSFIYLTAFVIYLYAKKSKEETFSAYKKAIIMPYVILTAMFMPTFLLQAINPYGAIGSFNTASIFYVSYIVMLYRALTLKCDKPLFKIKGKEVGLVFTIFGVAILIAVVFFVLSLPAYIGVAVNPKMFSFMYFN